MAENNPMTPEEEFEIAVCPGNCGYLVTLTEYNSMRYRDATPCPRCEGCVISDFVPYKAEAITGRN